MPVRLDFAAVETAARAGGTVRANLAAAELAAKGMAPLRFNTAAAELVVKGAGTARLVLAAAEALIAIGSVPVVSTEILPLAPGLAWSVHVAPKFKTQVASHISGREIRTAWQQYAIYDLSLSFEVLHGDASQEIQTLLGFFLARQGQYDTFLLDLGAVTQNGADDTVTSGRIGTGDGATTVFTLVRAVGEAVEPVGYVFPADLAGVYVANVLQDPVSYTFAAPNTVTFNTAPANGSQITASFRYYFVCRFAADTQDFEEFMTNLWSLHELKLTTVLP